MQDQSVSAFCSVLIHSGLGKDRPGTYRPILDWRSFAESADFVCLLLYTDKLKVEKKGFASRGAV